MNRGRYVIIEIMRQVWKKQCGERGRLDGAVHAGRGIKEPAGVQIFRHFMGFLPRLRRGCRQFGLENWPETGRAWRINFAQSNLLCMKLPRAIAFGIIMWILIFVILSIIMFTPTLKDKTLAQNIIFWILLIPVTLFAAKWYFKQDAPSVKKGFWLGIIGLLSASVLDLIITIPLFIAQGRSYAVALQEFYGNWMTWVGLLEFVLLCVVAGYEFDKTFTKHESKHE
ncbi:MAG: hypothetical protein A3C90_00430 [Candidatus Magasanikbacteria bacterium RIFCSPHIGHO2_02_FULL_51_14]|uniref:DUF5367 domain-containing protein n=1 Tax=Candidatus Magasanikbacteria bacterium RIFCSPHIGHO2_02_FULL_51_14 TaxID=1798683 RepID=A0A1F6ME83_9BACT|nr:MAG: hypothetical protein A3C90_00430 [Candidatus Magasanikbacteria bacterium RIFCSPHIGHO2_02_FULL_51_14]